MVIELSFLLYYYFANVTEKTIQTNKKNNFLKYYYRFRRILIFVENKIMLQIKEILRDKGITGKELANRLDITENAVSLIINGKRQPRFELLKEIAEILDVDIRDLFVPTKESAIEVLYIETEEGFKAVGEIDKSNIV